jgi:energy-converting hydrogenase B subunit Q
MVMEPAADRCAIRIIAENRKGVLRDIATIVADHEANILMISQETFDTGPYAGMAELYFEYEPSPDDKRSSLISDLSDIPSVHEVKAYQPFGDIFGSRVIIIGGGAQVAQVALGAVNEADRHNIRGERISVDTIPLVGERTLALAVDAVARLPRASILVLAGSIMGGEITKAVDRVKEAGIPVIALKMAGSVPAHADLVVTDPIQAGVFAVMHVSSKAVFDISRVKGREF